MVSCQCQSHVGLSDSTTEARPAGQDPAREEASPIGSAVPVVDVINAGASLIRETYPEFSIYQVQVTPVNSNDTFVTWDRLNNVTFVGYDWDCAKAIYMTSTPATSFQAVKTGDVSEVAGLLSLNLPLKFPIPGSIEAVAQDLKESFTIFNGLLSSVSLEVPIAVNPNTGTSEAVWQLFVQDAYCSIGLYFDFISCVA